MNVLHHMWVGGREGLVGPGWGVGERNVCVCVCVWGGGGGGGTCVAR